jgi:hypothetical protein
MASLRELVEEYLPLSATGAAEAVAELFEPDGLVDEPAGRAAGRRELQVLAERRFIWLAERRADVRPVRTTSTVERAVHECVLTLAPSAGSVVELPVALVGEPGPQGLLARLRVYHSTWPLRGRHEVRPRLLPPDPSIRLEGAVASYQEALAAGSVAGVLAAFAAGGCAREPAGGEHTSCGHEELAKFYAALFANGGGIALEHATLTDDGVAAAIEYTCVRWGSTTLPPQAGVAVYERGDDGLLVAARIYDDVDPPL